MSDSNLIEILEVQRGQYTEDCASLMSQIVRLYDNLSAEDQTEYNRIEQYVVNLYAHYMDTMKALESDVQLTTQDRLLLYARRKTAILEQSVERFQEAIKAFRKLLDKLRMA
jgi:hypothetical protein